MEEQQNKLAMRNVGDQVIARVNQMCEVGLTLPHGYNPNNAVKATMLILQELKDKNQRPALEVCTPVSVQTALFKMVTKGLDASKKQCYFIVRGNQLCCDDSYFGKVTQVRRIYPYWYPLPRVIYKSDEFVYETDPATGLRKVISHKQQLENIDEGFDIENGFKGAYIYIPMPNGGQDLYLMTNQQIRKAWAKSSMAGLGTHKAFTAKMIEKTIINSACNMIINSYPSDETAAYADDDNDEKEAQQSGEQHIEEVAYEDAAIEPAPEEVTEHIETINKDENVAEYDF